VPLESDCPAKPNVVSLHRSTFRSRLESDRLGSTLQLVRHNLTTVQRFRYSSLFGNTNRADWFVLCAARGRNLSDSFLKVSRLRERKMIVIRVEVVPWRRCLDRTDQRCDENWVVGEDLLPFVTC